MSPAVLVREARQDDLPVLARLYTQLSRHNAPDVTDAHHAAWAQLEAQPHTHQLVAELDGRVVGTLLVAVIPNLTRGARPFGVVESVVVDESARGQGVGSALMGAAETFARQAGAYKVMLMTVSEKTAAVALYRSRGFDGDTKVAFEKRF